jgi:hypothetical protein
MVVDSICSDGSHGVGDGGEIPSMLEKVFGHFIPYYITIYLLPGRG